MANLSVEEPDALMCARPGLWEPWAGNCPGPPSQHACGNGRIGRRLRLYDERHQSNQSQPSARSQFRSADQISASSSSPADRREFCDGWCLLRGKLYEDSLSGFGASVVAMLKVADWVRSCWPTTVSIRTSSVEFRSSVSFVKLFCTSPKWIGGSAGRVVDSMPVAIPRELLDTSCKETDASVFAE